MDDLTQQDQAIDLLQELGLKEYEAKSFVALARLPSGTAKDISEISDVPRTRVYDAINVLETQGLVEVQHSSPQRFRAIAIDEAVQTLKTEYENRAETLRRTLRGLEPANGERGTDVTHEVWALAGATAITSRSHQLIDDADREIILVLGQADVFTDRLADHLRQAADRGVSVIVGTITADLRDRIARDLPAVEVFVSELDWLSHSPIPSDTTEITRLLLVDREMILVSSFTAINDNGRDNEHAVFGKGFDNGLVTIVRRLMATGLLGTDDPAAG